MKPGHGRTSDYGIISASRFHSVARHADFRIVADGPDGLGAGHRRLSASVRSSETFATQRAGRLAGSFRTASAASLHEPVAQEFLDRHAVLSARFVHDEIQPARLQFTGAARWLRGAASVRAGIV